MSGDDLARIELRNGVNEAGEPFCTTVAILANGRFFIGQLSPAEARAHALAMLEVAEAAEQDAAVLRTIRKLGLQDELAGLIVAELRDSRS